MCVECAHGGVFWLQKVVHVSCPQCNAQNRSVKHSHQQPKAASRARARAGVCAAGVVTVNYVVMLRDGIPTCLSVDELKVGFASSSRTGRSPLAGKSVRRQVHTNGPERVWATKRARGCVAHGRRTSPSHFSEVWRCFSHLKRLARFHTVLPDNVYKYHCIVAARDQRA